MRAPAAALLALASALSLCAQSLDTALWEEAGRYAADPKPVRALIARGANPNGAGADGSTPLIAAVRYANVAAMRALLTAGADANRQANLTTALCEAIALSSATPVEVDDMVVLLLRHGANPNLRCVQGNSPLSNAILRSADFQVGVLIAAGARVDDADGNGTPLVVTAAHYGPSRIVRRLLDAGADVNARTSWGQTPLAAAKNTTIAALLLERGAALAPRDLREGSIIRMHVTAGRHQVAQFLRLKSQNSR
jgi:ankyrin repeat protein